MSKVTTMKKLTRCPFGRVKSNLVKINHSIETSYPRRIGKYKACTSLDINVGKLNSKGSTFTGLTDSLLEK